MPPPAPSTTKHIASVRTRGTLTAKPAHRGRRHASWTAPSACAAHIAHPAQAPRYDADAYFDSRHVVRTERRPVPTEIRDVPNATSSASASGELDTKALYDALQHSPTLDDNFNASVSGNRPEQ